MSRASEDTSEITNAAALFAALGDETRLALVNRLGAAGPLSIAGLTSGSGVSRQAITTHLHVLADAGFVHGVRRGRERIWELDTERLDEAHRTLDQISKQWDKALDRLKRFVEK